MKCCVAKLLLAASLLTLLLLTTLLVFNGPAAGQESPVLSLETHIPLPNVKGRIDHLSVDVKGQRLFVAAVDNHTLEVVDLKSGQRVHTVTDLAEPQECSTTPPPIVCSSPAALTVSRRSLMGPHLRFWRL
jgi:hypothetical protein